MKKAIYIKKGKKQGKELLTWVIPSNIKVIPFGKIGDKLFLKSVIKDTPFTNKFETMPRVHPTLSPIRSNEKRSINRFLILVVIDLPYKILCKIII